MKETEIIARISKMVSGRRPSWLVRGIGDDCAVIKPGAGKGPLEIITCDSVCEGTHFKSSYFRPWEIGAKAAAVNISDICAMGGTPKYALLNLGLTGKEKPSFINAMCEGIIRYLENYGACLVGGDTVKSGRLFISITLAGTVEKKRAMYRNGAGDGDIICVTGPLGDSYAGLKVLKRRGRKKIMNHECLPVKKHLTPQPRFIEGRLLGESGLVSACMDISDGLVNDAARIAEQSGRGAEIYVEKLPVTDNARKIASSFRNNPYDYALYGGEDFELLFTVPRKKIGRMFSFAAKNGLVFFPVGRIKGRRGVTVISGGKKRRENYKKAWKHF